MLKKNVKKNNFILAKEREGKGPFVIQILGYTSDLKALYEPWICTQLRTVFHKDRSHLPDPFVFKHNLECYKITDATVYTMYFTPECKKTEDAINEFAKYLLDEYEKNPTRKITLIGYSKGGLFVGALTDYLDIRINPRIILVAPTIGTVTGDEKEMLRRIEKYVKDNPSIKVKFEAKVLKTLVKIAGSRRPIDYDMAENSCFVKKHDFRKLSLYKETALIIAIGSKHTLMDRFFSRFGEYMGLPKNSDGMMAYTNKEQKEIFVYVGAVFEVEATHPTILDKEEVNNIIFKLLVGGGRIL